MRSRDWFLPFGFHIIKRTATSTAHQSQGRNFGLIFWEHRKRLTCDLFLGSTVFTVRRRHS